MDNFKEFAENIKMVGEDLKKPYKTVVNRLLEDIGVADEGKHRLVMDTIPRWKGLEEDKQSEIGVNVAGRYRLAKFLVLMEKLSKEYEEESERMRNTIDEWNSIDNVNCIKFEKEDTE